MGTVRYTVINGAVLSENRNATKRDYLPDPLGSTLALLDNTQTKTDTFAYWPYGEVASRTGTTPTPLQYVGNKSYYRDNASRTYVSARVLDTRATRWMTQDPIGFRGGDWNLYRYVWNNPTTHTDPTGKGKDFGTIDLPCPPAVVLGCKAAAPSDWVYNSCTITVTYGGKPPVKIYCNYHRRPGGHPKKKMLPNEALYGPIQEFLNCVADCAANWLTSNPSWLEEVAFGACVALRCILPPLIFPVNTRGRP